ncbi:SigB/SigF/SigG family RNA polymerase sigma factor [Prauserella muralis]|uniref:RNA polymerase subunit sigma n=1 Tax=Prauserella muralis TaxID=588067 RepID=A0A2V4B901_9PSEU|nr:SigB/SigF/SigG family RNA polymerase sigma factor [Prauserella muralis]PXY31895.1 RNA polymerase subunit sigma [Prauserella muralis]TWE13687.1 RNA polymerase sigma-28 (SigD/FliA/WhiG) subunit [Prauserella muralis]
MTESTTHGPRNSSDDYDHLVPLFEEFVGLAEDDPRRAELRDELVTGHLPLAEHIAQRFSGRGVAKEDLEQVARVGLINAVDRFDPGRGTDFLSFAVPTVMGEVRRHFRDTGWIIRVPRRLKELHLSINNASTQLSQHLGRAPTPSEIAEHLGLSPEEVYEGLEAGNAYHSMSLDEVLSGDTENLALGDTLGEDDAALEGVENHETLQPLVRELPERERKILALRFVHNMTQSQIAERIGISQMHVSRLLARTLAKLRDGLAEERPDQES